MSFICTTPPPPPPLSTLCELVRVVVFSVLQTHTVGESVILLSLNKVGDDELECNTWNLRSKVPVQLISEMTVMMVNLVARSRGK